MDVKRILNNAVAVRALTGLDREEFARLLPALEKELARVGRRNWQGQPRQRASGAGPNGCLPTAADMLFFCSATTRSIPSSTPWPRALAWPSRACAKGFTF